MNIWLFNHYAVPPQYYYIHRYNSFASELIKRGHSVTIFCASSVHNSDINLIEDNSPFTVFEQDGVRYVVIKCKSYKTNGVKRVLNMREFARKLPGICRKFTNPNVIIAKTIPLDCAKSGIKIAKKIGCKIIVDVTDLWPESLVSYGLLKKNNLIIKYLRNMEKWIYKNCDELVFSMEGAYEYIKDQKWDRLIPKSKVHFINNGIDCEKYDYEIENNKYFDSELQNRDKYKVVYTGSIRRGDNVGVLIDAAKNLDSHYSIFIFGSGNEYDLLKARIETEKIKNVYLKGQVDKKFIPSILSYADASIFTVDNCPIIRYGISPNKLFDYIASKKPIICTLNAPFNPADKYNLCIHAETYSAEGIANAIKKAASLNKEEIETIKKNSVKAISEYNFAALTDKLLKVIGL